MTWEVDGIVHKNLRQEDAHCVSDPRVIAQSCLKECLRMM